MKKIKKLILLTIIVIIITILLILINNKKNVEYNYGDGDSEPTMEEISNQESVTPVTNSNMYYTVIECINTYLHDVSTATPRGISMTDQEEIAMTEEEKANRIYNELSKEYIKENNITISNVRQYVHSSEEYISFYPIDMKVIIQGDSLTENYGAYGRVRNTTTGEFIGYTYIIVTIDLDNKTYAIKPIINEEISSLNELDLTTKVTSIEKNANNQFSYQIVNDESLVKKYIATYKMYALNHPEIAYEYLDEEYRNTRFESVEAFKQYVNENKSEISSIVLDKYQKTIKDGYTQYVCIDTKGNYYIFRETAVMKYTLLLDTYTVDIPEFTEKYNKADNETKVGMNIEKILTALNTKDYNYIYNKLANSFKNNYFPTVDSLKQYIQTNFYEKNTIEYDSVDNEGINYMFDIKINNATNSESAPVSKRIIMQLKEGTDYVFSFNVD